MKREQKNKIMDAVKRQLRIELDLLDQGAMLENAIEDNDISEDEKHDFEVLLSKKINQFISSLF